MQIDLNKLERLAEAATPGPWAWTPNEGWAYPQTNINSEAGTQIARFVGGKPQFCGTVGEARQEWRNAEFIAAANPTVALELVRRLREAEKWKTAVLDRLEALNIKCKKHEHDPEFAVRDCIDYSTQIALDPHVSDKAAHLIEAEREACAKVCDVLDADPANCAAAIRARGNQSTKNEA